MTMLPKKMPEIETRRVRDKVLVHDSQHHKVHVVNSKM
jgi:hypothetical protein